MKGYIGFFDILGYQSFLKNNSDDVIQEEVLNYITKIESPDPDYHEKVYPGVKGNVSEELFKSAFSKINRLVFSDTIVFALEPGNDDFEKGFHYLIAMGLGEHLMSKMFEYGLPLRGAIHYGEYKFSGHSMAGRGVVDAYECANRQNLSICALTESMLTRKNEIENMREKIDLVFKNQTCMYSTPLTNGDRVLQRALRFRGEICKAADFRDYTYSKFWAHGKDLGSDNAVAKVEETERFIRYCHKLNEKKHKG